jgi:phosphate transport system substrate-binding protein
MTNVRTAGGARAPQHGGDGFGRRPRSTPPFLRVLAGLVVLGGLAGCGGPGGSPGGTPGTGGQQTIVNIGSDTMVNLALAWAEAYRAENPQVSLSVTGGGSGTGLAALVNGTTDIANASRAIKADERANAEANGITPVEFVVARDAIAIVINHDNPVSELSLPQLSAMYQGQITNWAEVGGRDGPIVLLSRETNSGTHVYFLENVLRLGDAKGPALFSPDTLLLPSSEGITTEVRRNPNAIGYDGLGYVTPEVKTVAVSAKDGGPFVQPSIAAVNDGSYPIARDLYMYTAGEPQGAVRAYLDWISGPAAQQIVADLGFVPVLDQ